MQAAYSLVRENWKRCAQRRKRYYDLRVKKADIQPNTWDWYYYPRKYKGRSAKLSRIFVEPYLVTRLVGDTNAVIQRTKRSKPIVAHLDKLKVCLCATPQSWLNLEAFVPVDCQCQATNDSECTCKHTDSDVEQDSQDVTLNALVSLDNEQLSDAVNDQDDRQMQTLGGICEASQYDSDIAREMDDDQGVSVDGDASSDSVNGSSTANIDGPDQDSRLVSGQGLAEDSNEQDNDRPKCKHIKPAYLKNYV
jgi:hypothetical protein